MVHEIILACFISAKSPICQIKNPTKVSHYNNYVFGLNKIILNYGLLVVHLYM